MLRLLKAKLTLFFGDGNIRSACGFAVGRMVRLTEWSDLSDVSDKSYWSDHSDSSDGFALS